LVAAGDSNMKRLLLECGGKAPNIVFGDAPDLAAVADGIIARASGIRTGVYGKLASARPGGHQGWKLLGW